MTEAAIIRHSISAYPKDELKKEGIQYAKSRAGEFRDFSLAVTSEKYRAQQTMQALGYLGFCTDERFNELELEKINAPTAHEYVIRSHEQCPALVSAAAQVLIAGLVDVASRAEGRLLVVSHNLVLSALLRELTGNIESFDYLQGMLLEIANKEVSFKERI